jgi:predicted RNA-binding Zn ribbon-like protein
LSEDILMGLLNSTPVVDGTPTDALTTWADANEIPTDETSLAILRRARHLLQSVVRGRQPPAALAPLIEGVASHPSLGADGVSWTLDVTGAREAVVRAVLSWDELTKTRPGRLRACANDECALFLLDRSRTNNARWCSMSTCGNKLKARRHYQRTRPT